MRMLVHRETLGAPVRGPAAPAAAAARGRVGSWRLDALVMMACMVEEVASFLLRVPAFKGSEAGGGGAGEGSEAGSDVLDVSFRGNDADHHEENHQHHGDQIAEEGAGPFDRGGFRPAHLLCLKLVDSTQHHEEDEAPEGRTDDRVEGIHGLSRIPATTMGGQAPCAPRPFQEFLSGSRWY